MATQTGSIDLRGANSAKLYVDDEAGDIRSEVSETYATKTEVRRTDSDSGTVISSDDAANLPPLSLAIHGKSVQDGTPSPSSPVEIRSVEGRNLYNLNGNLGSTNKCTYTVDGDEVVMSATGTDGFIGNVSLSAGATWSAAYGLLMPVVGGESYALYLGNSFFNKNYITWWSAEKTSISFNYWNDSIMSFKAPDTAAYATLRFGSASTVASTEYRTTVYFGHGAVSEQYVHQPYGAISIATVGKNVARLLPSALVTESDGVFSATGSTLNAIYANNGASCIVRAADGGYFPESTTLSFDAYTDGNASTSGNGLVVAARNSSNAIAKYMVQAPNSTSAWTKFSADLSGVENATEIIISYMSAGGNIWHIRNFCIRTDGSTEYVPFDGSTAYIPLQGNAVCATPSVSDVLEVDSEGNVTLTKNTMRKVCNGTETWRLVNDTSTSYYYETSLYPYPTSDGITGNSSTQMCNLAPILNPDKKTDVCAWVYTLNTQTNLRFGGFALKDLGVTDLATLKTWLGENNLEVIYPLATPQTISLGTIDLPSLPSPSFSMHVDALVTPTVDAEWWTQGGEEVGSVYQRTSALEQDVDGLTLELSEKVDSSEEWVSWLHAGTDATTHEPYLAMGQDSDYPSVVYGSDAARFYDGEGDAAANVVAEFGSSAIIGKAGAAHFEQTSTAAKWYGGDGTTQLAEVSVDSNHPRLWLGDEAKRLYTFTSGGVDYITLHNGGSTGHAQTRMVANGSGGTATIVASDNGTSGGNLVVTPSSIVLANDTTAQSSLTVTNGLTVSNGFTQNTTTAAVTLGTNAQAAWLTALGMDVETIQNDSAWTILRYGHVVMVQCHGYSGTANASTAKLAGVLADYKPAYNVSATISSSSGNDTQTARLCVYASDGGVYIAPAGYTSSASWYGTLTYIYG